jgi:hypothetical protein
METTLGMANYRRAPNGEIEVSDSYDFNASRKQVEEALREKGIGLFLMDAYKHAGMWGVANALGNMFAGNDGEGTPYTLNLGKVQ